MPLPKHLDAPTCHCGGPLLPPDGSGTHPTAAVNLDKLRCAACGDWWAANLDSNDDLRMLLHAWWSVGAWAEREVGAERDALRAAVEVTLADLDGAIAEGERRNGRRGGQRVTYTGPLATICGLPGPLNDLRRMAATLRAALAPTEKTP